MTAPDPQTLGGVLASLAVAAVSYWKYVKAQKERPAWVQDECQKAISEAFLTLSKESKEAFRALSREQAEAAQTLSLENADALRQLSAEHASDRNAVRIMLRNVMADRLVDQKRIAILEREVDANSAAHADFEDRMSRLEFGKHPAQPHPHTQ